MSDSDRSFSFHDVPKHWFPFTVKFMRESDGVLVHTIEVPDAGVVDVPYLAGEHGPIKVEIVRASDKAATN